MIYRFFLPAAMVAFAANSLLCRAALGETLGSPAMDAIGFSLIRLGSGAIFLGLLSRLTAPPKKPSPSSKKALPHVSAAMLLIYVLGFSLAYRELDTGTGALILFGSVQITMVGHGFIRPSPPGKRQIWGMLIAFGGLALLFLPGATMPSAKGGVLMAVAGGAWGIYSILGKTSTRPLFDTSRNFTYALVPALGIGLVDGLFFTPGPPWPIQGILLAVTSGALASGAGYALWYKALERLDPARAGVVQLSVPILAALGGILFLKEALSLRLMGASILVFPGIALAMGGQGPKASRANSTGQTPDGNSKQGESMGKIDP